MKLKLSASVLGIVLAAAGIASATGVYNGTPRACMAIRSHSSCDDVVNADLRKGIKNVEEICAGLQGEVSVNACPGGKRVGVCQYPSPDGAKQYTRHYYTNGGTPWTPDTSRQDCENFLKGRWFR